MYLYANKKSNVGYITHNVYNNSLCFYVFTVTVMKSCKCK